MDDNIIGLRVRRDDRDLDALVDELVEAHLDTIEMLESLVDDPSWASHAGYLKGLVRYTHRLQALRSAALGSP